MSTNNDAARLAELDREIAKAERRLANILNRIKDLQAKTDAKNQFLRFGLLHECCRERNKLTNLIALMKSERADLLERRLPRFPDK